MSTNKGVGVKVNRLKRLPFKPKQQMSQADMNKMKSDGARVRGKKKNINNM